MASDPSFPDPTLGENPLIKGEDVPDQDGKSAGRVLLSEESQELIQAEDGTKPDAANTSNPIDEESPTSHTHLHLEQQQKHQDAKPDDQLEGSSPQSIPNTEEHPELAGARSKRSEGQLTPRSSRPPTPSLASQSQAPNSTADSAPSSSKSIFVPPDTWSDPSRDKALDEMTSAELASALEPFGYTKDEKTGQQRTTLKNLPRILYDFQKSRDTIYLTESALRDMEIYAAQFPDKEITNDFVMPLLLAVKQSNDPSSYPATNSLNTDQPDGNANADNYKSSGPRSPSAQRTRTADSPPSSDGEQTTTFFGTDSQSPSPAPSLREPGDNSSSVDSLARFDRRNAAKNLALDGGDDSFDASHENTIQGLVEPRDVNDASPSSEDTAFQPTLAHHTTPVAITTDFKKPLPTPRLESTRASPSPFSGNARTRRPMPPNRRRKPGTADNRRVAGPRDEKAQASGERNEPASQNAAASIQPSQLTSDEQESTAADGSEIDPTSCDISLGSPLAADHSPAPPLTAQNMSEVICQNREKGLYSDTYSDTHDDEQETVAQKELMRRIRDRPNRPNSRIYTRVFESQDMTRGYSELESDYTKLLQEYQELKGKTKELEGKMSDMEKIHENEVISLSEELEELNEVLGAKRKHEKELTTNESRYRFQLARADEEVSKLHKEIAQLQANYQKIKQKYEDSISELDKLRFQLRSRDEELRYANQSLQSHAIDLRKWDEERRFMDEHIQKLQNERNTLQHASEFLEQQKQANIELQSTIDRLKHELDESRAMNSGNSLRGSRPTSLAGSVSQSFGEELKKAMASGEYDDEGCDSDTTEDGQEILKRIGGFSSDGRVDDNGDEVYEEIRIHKIKRRTLRDRTDPDAQGEPGDRSRQLIYEEDEIELKHAQTDTSDLLSTSSKLTQTDPIAEPPPVYRPKMEDLSIQTDSAQEPQQEEAEAKKTNEEADPKEALQKYISDIDPMAPKDVLENSERNSLAASHSNPELPSEIHDDLLTNSSPSALANSTPTLGYFQRLGLGSTTFKNSVINIISSNTPSSRDPDGAKPEFNLRNTNLRTYITVFGFLATGYVLGNLLIPGLPPRVIVHMFVNSDGPGIAVSNSLWVSYNMIGGGREGFAPGYPASWSGVFHRLTDLGFRLIWEGVHIAKRNPT